MINTSITGIPDTLEYHLGCSPTLGANKSNHAANTRISSPSFAQSAGAVESDSAFWNLDFGSSDSAFP